MHIVHEPKITLLARQAFLGAPHIRWESDSDVAAQVTSEFAGRLCYLSFGPDAGFEGGHRLISGRTTNEEYLQNILRVRHGSVLEHGVWTFLFEGVSRALTHELVRHRHFSYSQLSQRYVDESDVAFVLPPEIREGTDAYDMWKESCEQALDAYRHLLAIIEEQVKDEPSKTCAASARARPHAACCPTPRRRRSWSRETLAIHRAARLTLRRDGDPYPRHHRFAHAAPRGAVAFRRLPHHDGRGRGGDGRHGVPLGIE